MCIFPELLKYAFMLMEDHIRKCALTFHTDVHTDTHLPVNLSKKAFGGYNGWCVGVCVGSANAFGISQSAYREDSCQPH